MSGSRGTVRKVYDIQPKSVTSNGSYDGSSAPTTSWASGTLNNPEWLSNIAEGVTDNGRVGISVACETLDIRIKIIPQDTVIGHKYLRIFIVADNECDGAFPAYTDILGDTAGAATTSATGLELSFLQPAYFGRFKVIEDKTWAWFQGSTTSLAPDYSNCQHPFSHIAHHDLKDHRLMWDTTDAAAIANARRGHIFMYALYTNVVTTAGGIPTLTFADPPTIQYTSRIRFYDDGGGA